MHRNVLLLCLAGCVPGAVAAGPQMLRFYTPTPTGEPRRIYDPFTTECEDITFTPGRECSCDSTLKGIHVEIHAGSPDAPCATGDMLHQPQISEIERPISVEKSTDCMMVLKGRASLRVYLEEIRKVQFSTTATDEQPRYLRYWLGHGWFNKVNEHYYALYKEEDTVVYGHLDNTWLEGQHYCSHPENDMLGMIGYLATVTTQQEFDFLDGDIKLVGSLGGSDMESESQWAWVTGPEGCSNDYVTTYDLTMGEDDVLLRSMCPMGLNFNTQRKPFSSNMTPNQCTGTNCCQGNGQGGGDGKSNNLGTLDDKCDGGPNYGTLFWEGGPAGQGGRPVPATAPVLFPSILPDQQKAHADFLRTDWSGKNNKAEATLAKAEGFDLYFQDALIFVPAGNAFVCEWGGVGTMCVEKTDLFHTETLVYIVDECAEYCEPCENGKCDSADPVQTCEDPMPHNAETENLNNWVCKCVLGKNALDAQGVDTGLIAVAQCVYDECTDGNGTQCVALGQSCDDATKTTAKTGDFVCECPADQTGEKQKGGVATCIINECDVQTKGVEKCTDQNQDCEDKDTAPGSTDDWYCTCRGDRNGTAKANTATCTIDECLYGDGLTACVNQTCEDDNKADTPRGNFVCTCAGNEKGSAVGKKAECMLNECLPGEAGATLCGSQNPPQDCLDTEQNETGNFVCICDETKGYKGTGNPGKKAKCTFDQCVAGGVLRTKCEAAVAFGTTQVCVDDDHTDPNDAYCQCPEPAESLTNISDAVSSCAVDECRDPKNFATCDDVGQECVDPDKDTKDDWRCLCKDPNEAVPAGTWGDKGPATTCQPKKDDCELHKTRCEGQTPQQTCHPGNDPNDGKVTCKCPDTHTTDAAGNDGPATCSLNECTGDCVWCENGDCAKAPGSAEQKCNDPDEKVDRNWVCECQTPYAGTSAVEMEVATCTIDECKESCQHCENGTVCGAGQVCLDRTATEEGNWFCLCSGEGIVAGPTAPSPLRPATANVCIKNECAITENANKCQGADPPQDCQDRFTEISQVDDWECVCANDDTQFKKADRADCEVDECKENDNAKKCTNVGQICVDNEKKKDGSWECECTGNATGSATGKPAECKVDECTIAGKGECPAEQECLDPDHDEAKEGDWMCVCYDSNGKYLDSAIGGEVPGGCPKRNECKHESTAAQSGKHIPRYTVDGCMCSTTWESTCGGQLPCDGLGSPGKPCTSGCCRPDHDQAGDWCFTVDNSYNRQHAHCDPTVIKDPWGYCLPSGALPDIWAATWAAAGVEPLPYNRADIEGYPSDESNVCTDAGQTCSDPEPDTEGSWICKCAGDAKAADVAERNGVKGAPVTLCVLDECDLYGTKCTEAEPKGSQVCRDPTAGDAVPSKEQDWVCECTGADKLTTETAPVEWCVFNECDETCETCEKGRCNDFEQDCEDKDESAESLKDWYCVCRAPQTGEQKMARATCELNECSPPLGQTENICEQNNQTCYDKNTSPGSQEDWYCQCKWPSTTTADTGFVTECLVNECKTGDGRRCAGEDQDCYDSNHTELGTWKCECRDEWHGSAENDIAVCKRDECDEHGATCHSKGQVCEDTNTTTENTWQCKCMPDETGTPQALGTATCVKDGECVANAATCEDKGQHCHDGPGSGDWVCQCFAPWVSASGDDGDKQPADCILDECGQVCSSCQRTFADEKKRCEEHGQVCKDVDPRVEGDWQCECTGDETPTQPYKAKELAQCELDECSKRGGDAECAKGNQTCVDEFKGPLEVRGWKCKCPDSDIMKPLEPANCPKDECEQYGSTCENESPPQECLDAHPESTGDWVCVCKDGYAMATPGRPATGCNDYDECTTVCPNCADTGKGHTCDLADQGCEDPAPLSDHGNWRCVCKFPSTGFAEKAKVEAQDCVLNECDVGCVHCARGTNGGDNKCEAVGQVCVDTNAHAGAIGDWECQCNDTLSFISQTKGIAKCEFNECEDVDPASGQTVPPGVLKCGTQGCDDTHLTTMSGDFVCSCPSPMEGHMTGEPAQCTLDECTLAHAFDECDKYGQHCRDRFPTSADDWVCECSNMIDIKNISHVEVCGVDECETNAAECRAAVPPQRCVDEDPYKNGSWVCECGGFLTAQPFTGAQSKAVCELNECTSDCDWCANGRCEAWGQTCVDEDTAANSTGDWKCLCDAPSTDFEKTMPVWKCSVDECSNNTACGTGQRCEDSKKYAEDNWVCVCLSDPTAKNKTASVQKCSGVGLDECVEDCVECAGKTCKVEEQGCRDTNYDTLGSWECYCYDDPTTTGKPAVCGTATSDLDECEILANQQECISQHPPQKCEDHFPTTKDDWRCYCYSLDGDSGSFRQAGRAPSCEYFGECAVHAHTCEAVSERCHDPTPAEDNGDWRCECVGFQQGAGQVGGQANCSVADNECAACQGQTPCPFEVCDAADQVCVDAFPGPGNWQCNCKDNVNAPLPAAPGPRDCSLQDGGAAGFVRESSCTLCWLLPVLLALLCSSCLLLALLLLRRRHQARDEEHLAYNKTFEPAKEDELEDVASAGRSEFKGGASMGHASLLSWENRSPANSSPPVTPLPTSPKPPNMDQV